jgi:NAD(P)-dependent dehydrogenase (short-subunit alcohol dehydrogenase family)
MQELQNKVAIITGASKGIGAATAKRMAELGIKVVLTARSQDALQELAEEIKSKGGDAMAIACDVADYNQVNSAVAQAIMKFGKIDIVVNNAGLIDPIGHITDIPPEDWGKVIDVNVKGIFNMLHATLPGMEARGEGVVINISSGAATSALEGWSHYCSSKAAALMLTKAAHKEYAEKGIRVVGLSPGTVATDMQVNIKASGINPVSTLEASDHIPPEWPAEAICWLATEDAREFDGGDVSLRDEAIRKRCGLN